MKVCFEWASSYKKILYVEKGVRTKNNIDLKPKNF